MLASFLIEHVIIIVACLGVSQSSLGSFANDCPALAGQDCEISSSEERIIENFEEDLVSSEVSSLVQMQARPKRKQLERETPNYPLCHAAPSLLQVDGESSTEGVAAYPMKLCYMAQVEEAMPAPHYLPNPWFRHVGRLTQITAESNCESSSLHRTSQGCHWVPFGCSISPTGSQCDPRVTCSSDGAWAWIFILELPLRSQSRSIVDA